MSDDAGMLDAQRNEGGPTVSNRRLMVFLTAKTALDQYDDDEPMRRYLRSLRNTSVGLRIAEAERLLDDFERDHTHHVNGDAPEMADADIDWSAVDRKAAELADGHREDGTPQRVAVRQVTSRLGREFRIRIDGPARRRLYAKCADAVESAYLEDEA